MNTQLISERDFHYMQHALELAWQAYRHDEVPIGALVVNSQGVIIGRGYNQIERKKSQLAHAELEAIAQATAAVGDWRLEGSTIYVTIEPCNMCFESIRLSRLDRLVYGAASPRFGYQLDKDVRAKVYKKNMSVYSGIYAADAQKLITDFFQKQREKKSGCKIRGSEKN